MKKSIIIASDHAGIELKEILKAAISGLGFSVDDVGPHDGASVDYPDYANKLCAKITADAHGILICGSGIGMSMAANRHKHVRAALCHDHLSVTLARRHNDANVLCIVARLTGVDVAKDMVIQFLTTEFEGGRHAGRIAKMA